MKAQQLDLLDYQPPPRALARARDPRTSHAAAASISSAALTEMESLVVAALTRAGRAGMTVDELVDDLDLDKVTVSPRLRPLCNKGEVCELRGVTRPGKSGRRQTVWVLVEHQQQQ